MWNEKQILERTHQQSKGKVKYCSKEASVLKHYLAQSQLKLKTTQEHQARSVQRLVGIKVAGLLLWWLAAPEQQAWTILILLMPLFQQKPLDNLPICSLASTAECSSHLRIPSCSCCSFIHPSILLSDNLFLSDTLQEVNYRRSSRVRNDIDLHYRITQTQGKLQRKCKSINSPISRVWSCHQSFLLTISMNCHCVRHWQGIHVKQITIANFK